METFKKYVVYGGSSTYNAIPTTGFVPYVAISERYDGGKIRGGAFFATYDNPNSQYFGGAPYYSIDTLRYN